MLHLVQPLVAFIGKSLAFVREFLPLVRDALPLVREPLALVGEAVSFIRPTHPLFKLVLQLLEAYRVRGYWLRFRRVLSHCFAREPARPPVPRAGLPA